MIIKIRIFDGWHDEYESLTSLAKAMGISVSQIYRVKDGKRSINQKFIVGAIKAFPQYKFEDLFYLSAESVKEENLYREALLRNSLAPEEKLPQDKHYRILNPIA